MNIDRWTVEYSICKSSEGSNGKEELILRGSLKCCYDDLEEGTCAEYGKNYYKTHRVKDWLECEISMLWVAGVCLKSDDMFPGIDSRDRKNPMKQKLIEKRNDRENPGLTTYTIKAMCWVRW